MVLEILKIIDCELEFYVLNLFMMKNKRIDEWFFYNFFTLPPTLTMSPWVLLNRPKMQKKTAISAAIFGRGSKIGFAATALIRFRSPAYWRLPFVCGQTTFSWVLLNRPKMQKKPPFRTAVFGRGSKIWTHDTRFWRPMLYQLSYTPIKSLSLI